MRAETKKRDEVSRREASELGRKIGLSQAAGELLQLLQSDKVGRDELWSLVGKLNVMASATTKTAEPDEGEGSSEEELLDSDELISEDDVPVFDDVTMADGVAITAGSGDREEHHLKLGYKGTGAGSERGPCYFLGWKPVEPRTELELLLTRSRWLRGAVDWTGRVSDRPTFHLILGGDWEPTSVSVHAVAVLPTVPIPKVSFELPDSAVLRWPEP